MGILDADIIGPSIPKNMSDSLGADCARLGGADAGGAGVSLIKMHAGQ